MDRQLKAAAYLAAEGRLRANAPPLPQLWSSEQLAPLTREGTMFPVTETCAVSSHAATQPGAPINNPHWKTQPLCVGEEAQT